MTTVGNSNSELDPQQLRDMNLIGQCPAFTACLSKLEKFACCRAPILVVGETGTGKEVAARALHYLGPRQGRAFIPVNCAALPESIFENELFGHRQGAYTDAKSHQAGLVDQAHGGTLFLDEVDSLSLHSQAALLRFLQDRKFRALGEAQDRQANVAIIAATNADLQQAVNEGRFRQDLLFRLNTVAVELPPLRERRPDIRLIATHFLYYLGELYGIAVTKTLDDAALAWLERQPWPGNIRELQNFLHREFLLTDDDVISIVDDEPSGSGRPIVQLSGDCLNRNYDQLRAEVLQALNHEYLHSLMSKTKGNVSSAAKLMHKDRHSLRRLLQNAGLDRRDYSLNSE